MKENSFIILSQSRENCQSSRRSPQESSQQLELFAAPDTGLRLKVKPQISTVRGICLKDPNKYQVTLGSEILGKYLTFDEALALTKLKKARKSKQLTKCLEILENQGIQGDLAIFALSLAADGGDANE